MSEEIVKYRYKLTGQSSSVKAVADLASEISYVKKAVLADNVLEIDVGGWTSEYDLFCSLNDLAEKHGVDVDNVEDVVPDNTADNVPEVSSAVETSSEQSFEEVEEQSEDGKEQQLPEEEKSWKKRYLGHFIELGIAAVLLILAAVCNFSANTQSFMCLIAFAVVGYEIIWDAVSAIYHKDILNYSISMIIVAVAAIFVTTYLEAAFIVFIFEAQIVLGKVLTAVSEEKVKARLKYDYVLIDCGGEEKTFAKDVPVGTKLNFAVGDTVPFDCEVKEGQCTVDEYNYCGVHRKSAVKQGDKIYGGVIIIEGEIAVTVKKTVSESLAGKIYGKFTEKQNNKFVASSVKFTKISAPVCLLIALVICFVIPAFIAIGGVNYSSILKEWAYLGIMFLALSNSFSSSLSMSLSYKSALKRALLLGCYVLSGDGFYNLGNVDTAIFAEPGALIDTELKADKIIAIPSYKGKITKVLGDYGLTVKELINIDFVIKESTVGRLAAGSMHSLAKNGYAVKHSNLSGEVRYILINGESIGAVSFNRNIGKNAYGAVNELKDAGVSSKVFISDSGDALSELSDLIDLNTNVSDSDIFKEIDNLEEKGINTVCAGISADKYTEQNSAVILDCIDNIIENERNCTIAIPSKGIKSFAKVVKLAKRYRKALKSNLIVSAVFKVFALVTGVACLFAVPANLLWVAVLIDGLGSSACLINAFRNGFNVY